VALILKQAGYHTAMYGKMGDGRSRTGSVPKPRDVGPFYGYLDQHAHNLLSDTGQQTSVPHGTGSISARCMRRIFHWIGSALAKDPRSSPFSMLEHQTIPHATTNSARLRGNA